MFKCKSRYCIVQWHSILGIKRKSLVRVCLNFFARAINLTESSHNKMKNKAFHARSVALQWLHRLYLNIVSKDQPSMLIP